jgi:hypothetical protein
MASVALKFITLLWLLFPIYPFLSQALSWSADYVEWNLNQNESANGPLEYWGEWQEHPKTPSPSNWRMPFYMLTLDRYVDGQPSNNDANGTVFEHDDWSTNQFRFGGDATGLMDNLDWIQDLGIKVSAFIFCLLPISTLSLCLIRSTGYLLLGLAFYQPTMGLRWIWATRLYIARCTPRDYHRMAPTDRRAAPSRDVRSHGKHDRNHGRSVSIRRI